MMLERGDLIFVQSLNWMSRAIRFFERKWGEKPSLVNHVAGVVIQADEFTEPAIVEANMPGVQFRRMSEARWGRAQVAIFRHANLSPLERLAVAQAALSYEGRKYGFAKIIAHALDWFLGKRFVFRRLAGMDNMPICSWVWSHAYRRGASVYFGAPANQVDPDDMYDHVVSHPEDWIVIRPLSPWSPK